MFLLLLLLIIIKCIRTRHICRVSVGYKLIISSVRKSSAPRLHNKNAAWTIHFWPACLAHSVQRRDPQRHHRVDTGWRPLKRWSLSQHCRLYFNLKEISYLDANSSLFLHFFVLSVCWDGGLLENIHESPNLVVMDEPEEQIFRTRDHLVVEEQRGTLTRTLLRTLAEEVIGVVEGTEVKVAQLRNATLKNKKRFIMHQKRFSV